ncbi:MAG TPA: LysR substrate-binding domain-containing protein [Plantibacter sp.]|uniref:LysR family transcriptional regulator n=1 Tax=unclassified Plantibacter TaxID=2624265 RepID=UPI002BE976A5|nr:LysR substrate-binding domain-containing protein [Plantibacter sp.]
MELRLLRAFVHAARETTFSGAAITLSLTQPALTKQIQQLEAIVGTSLFHRGRHGSELTAAGLALLDDAREIVDLAARFDARAKRVAGGEEGRLTVGFGLSSITVAPRAVAAFRAKTPGVSVSLEDMSSSAQLELVRNGRLDIAFARLPIPVDLHSVPVLTDHLAIAHPTGWEAPRNDRLLAEWLDRHPLVRLSASRGPGLAAQTSRFIVALGAQPAAIQDADDLQTVLALVAAGVGFAIVPESAGIVAPPRVEMVRLSGRGASWSVGVAWRPDNETPVVRGFLDELEPPGGR